jgi:hypothetical protein
MLAPAVTEGPAFFEHVRRLGRAVLNSPKGQTTPLPPDLARRPVEDPAPYWTWSLVSRRGETRPAIPPARQSIVSSSARDRMTAVPDARSRVAAAGPRAIWTAVMPRAAAPAQ